MRKLFFLVVFTFLFISHSQSQNYNWITPGKIYLKMSVADDGIYRIAKTDFTNAGINTATIDPRTVKVLYKGDEIPIYFQGENDGVFDAADYFDFYGTRNYGGLTKTYDDNNVVKYTTDEYYNLYSDTNTYWIDWGGANGLRMVNSNYTSPTNYPLNYYFDTIHLEKDKIFWLGEFLNSNDYGSFSNERYKGESWYWSLLNSGQSTSEVFSTPLLSVGPENASVRIFAYPTKMSSTISNENTIQVRINNNLVGTVTINDVAKFDTVFVFPSNMLSNVSPNTAVATYISNGGFNGSMFFDLFEITYPKLLKFESNRTLLRLSGTDTTSKLFKINGFIRTNPINIYDVKNGIKINTITSNADTLEFTGKSNSKFEVINKTITKKPLKIIQRQVPDYVSGSNGVDYLLIYNSLFESQVTQLKNYRESKDNFRVVKAEIKDIYDIFNYGIEDPVAIRNFVRHAYYNWQTPRIKYICLFGRGSLDPKKNAANTIYEKNLIPTFGNPSSDNFYANINSGNFTFFNQISIGRLPAYTTSEAQYMIDNIITYESQPTVNWSKTFTFIAGGVNEYEQNLFLAFNDLLINPYVLAPPVFGAPVRILRNDLAGGVTFNYPDSINNQINRGTLAVNFMGHAGYQDWELAMNDPAVLNNYNGLFPLVMSMTCYTGKVGDPYERAFGEKFMKMNNKGSIGFIGTSGWGFIGAGSTLNKNIYKAICTDTLRRIGDIFANAVYSMRNDSVLSNVRHTINCYTLQGDPALSLVLPKIPEYSITDSDYKISNISPSINEGVSLSTYPNNYGLFSDSCNVRFQILDEYSKSQIIDTTIYNFKSKDSLKFNFKLSEPGIYNISVILDYNNLNPNEDKTNNLLTLSIKTKDVTYLPLKPVQNEVIKSDSVELIGLNPLVPKNSNNIILLLEMDTTSYFNSPVKKTFFTNNVSGVATKFRTQLPVLDTNALYYWRTNSIINSDTTGWSPNQIFRYNPVVTDNSKIGVLDTNTLVYKNKPQQYNEADYVNTFFSNSGIKLTEYSGILKLRSLGSNGAEASYFNVLNKSIHIDAGGNTGLNLLKVRKADGLIVEHKNFKMIYSSSSDSVLNYLNTFDTTQYLMGVNSAYVAGGRLFSPATKLKFQQFGSTKIDSFVVGFFDSWAFIGYLNAPVNDVFEQVRRYNGAWTESIGSLTKTFYKNYGTVSNIIGPANSWKDFSWQNVIYPGSDLKFDVYGIDKSAQSTLLFSNLTINNPVNLSSVDAFVYPQLNFISKLKIDSVSGLHSPLLSSFKINYTDPAEIISDINAVWQSDSVITAGREMKIRLDYYNVGNLSVPGIIVNIYKTALSSGNLIKSDTINDVLNVDEYLKYNGKFTVPYIRMTNGKAQIVVEVKPKGSSNEFHTFNNYNLFDLIINTQTDVAAVEIFNEGREIKSGDYVSLKPELKININSINIGSSVTDTSQFSLILNNKYIPHNSIVNADSKLRSSKNIKDNLSGNSQISFTYKPDLVNGENNLRIIYKNEIDGYDSTDFIVYVNDELQIRDLYNYPNPMKGETSFIFNLTGSISPSNCKIKIYTVGGRLIKEINYSPVIGNNQIPWDGRDNDGDIIANGTYLYKFVAEDDSKIETAIQKLVVLK